MEKKFDSIQIVREIRDKMYEKTKDKTDDELIEYYKKKAEVARSVQEKYSEYTGMD